MEFMRKTIGGALQEIVRQYSDRDALVHTEMGVRYSYSFLWREVRQAAAGFIEAGIGRGDRVAICAPNIPQWIISFLALVRAGAVVVPIDPGAGKEDLHYILEHSECKAIIVSGGAENEGNLKNALEMRDNIPSLEQIFVISEESHPETVHWDELMALGEDAASEALSNVEDELNPEDPVAIMYTSGTTGKPKGVVLDHLGLINKSIFSMHVQGVTHEDRLVLFFPLFHMIGNTCIALSGLIKGAAVVLPCQSFEPSRILHAIDKEKCTAIYASPSMLIALIDHPEFQKNKWKSMAKGTIGGAPCPIELMRRLVEDIGVSDITVGYGITEASSWITMTNPDDPIDLRVSTIGTPLACNDVKIVDPATGEELPAKTQGELCTRGFLMKEYYKMPVATSAAIDRDGWFHTGDLGEMNEKGYVKITGRLKDVIERAGVEIYPVEVEEIIYQRSEVSEVQVFGFPHPEKGQEVAAWVKLKEGAQLSPITLAAHTRDFLDKDKVPHYFKIVSDFPMTRSGKVQKFKLAEMAADEYLKD